MLLSLEASLELDLLVIFLPQVTLKNPFLIIRLNKKEEEELLFLFFVRDLQDDPKVFGLWKSNFERTIFTCEGRRIVSRRLKT